ncbi:MAG TPA: hypothetical protein VGL23_03505 [Chloroflexota bacterium]|jgi:hypothetical protein
MTYSGRSLPQITPFGVSARFVDQHAANAATRALQKELGIPTEAIGVAAEPGAAAAEPSARDASKGQVRGGAVIVKVSVPDAELVGRVKALLAAAGGAELTKDEPGSPSVGGYGPTTAHGRVGIIGAEPETSSMAERSFQDALENQEREQKERQRRY